MSQMGLEHKFCGLESTLSVTEGRVVEGYASLFGKADQGGDVGKVWTFFHTSIMSEA